MATIKKEIQDYLGDNGRSTTSQMGTDLGYSTDQVRKTCKELLSEKTINGSKSNRIPAYIINDNYVVITGNRSQLLKLVEKYAPSEYSRAKSMSTEQLQNFLRDQVADQVVGGPKIWEFWV